MSERVSVELPCSSSIRRCAVSLKFDLSHRRDGIRREINEGVFGCLCAGSTNHSVALNQHVSDRCLRSAGSS